MSNDDVFFIVNVKAADMGVYSCTAQNVAGTVVANATLTVLGKLLRLVLCNAAVTDLIIQRRNSVVRETDGRQGNCCWRDDRFGVHGIWIAEAETHVDKRRRPARGDRAPLFHR